ncbi:MAG: CehA/McbA family metallohydrolase [Acidobacteriota bacterium]
MSVRAARVAMVLGSLVALAPLWPAPAVVPDASAQAGLRWFKGNTHSHTLNSDGDSTPDEVARWYRENGYHFVFLTDHNYLTSVDGLNAIMGADERFLILKGEEVTTRAGDKPVHVNGLNVERLVEPHLGVDVLDTIQKNVDAIRAAKGVPHVNHPNYGWAITAEDLAQVQRMRLFEIYSGHPYANNMGGGGSPGLEEMWDRILTSGRLLYGIAVDDAHHFKRPGDPLAVAPGRAWVVVRAAALTARAILDALERGDFYASTGVELDVMAVAKTSLSIRAKPFSTFKYRIQFIGREGKLLAESASNVAAYQFVGDEGYVRARVIDSQGRMAWVQPVPVGASAPK